MRTAEEWRKQIDFKTHDGFMASVRAIQADALRHAISIAAEEYDKGGTCHDIGAALQIAVNALEKETK